MTRTLLTGLACAAAGFSLSLLPASVASASPLTFQASGLIDGLSGPPANELQALLGQQLAVEYRFDPQTQDTDPALTRGVYLDPRGTVRVTAGDITYVASGVRLVVEDTPEGDLFSLSQIVSGPLFDLAPQAAVGLTFLDTTGAAFADDRLPKRPPLPGEFDRVGFALGFGSVDDDDPIDIGLALAFGPGVQDDDDTEFIFTITDDLDPIFPARRFDTNAVRVSAVTTVPEPTTVVAALVAVVFVACAVAHRRFVSTP